MRFFLSSPLVWASYGVAALAAIPGLTMHRRSRGLQEQPSTPVVSGNAVEAPGSSAQGGAKDPPPCAAGTRSRHCSPRRQNGCICCRLMQQLLPHFRHA